MRKILLHRFFQTDKLQKVMKKIPRSKVEIGDLISLDDGKTFYRVKESVIRGNPAYGYGESWNAFVLHEYNINEDRVIQNGECIDLLRGFTGEFEDGIVIRIEKPSKDNTANTALLKPSSKFQ